MTPIDLNETIEDPGKNRAGPSKDFIKYEKAMERAEQTRANDRLAPPQIVVQQCNVCKSPYRTWIDGLLLKGESYVSIAKHCPGRDGRKLDRRSISNHAKKHLSASDAAVRALLEEEAEQINQNFKEGVRGAITQRGVLEVALRKGFEDILNGVASVEPRDMIQITQQLRKMDEQTESAQVEFLQMQVNAFIQAIRKAVPQELWSDVIDEARRLMGVSNPIPAQSSEEVVDAVVVETPVLEATS